MIKVYSPGALNEPDKAVAAQEVITEVRPKARTFATLAVLAYDAGQTRKGDLARQKALDLSDPADRERRSRTRSTRPSSRRSRASSRSAHADADRHGRRQEGQEEVRRLK